MQIPLNQRLQNAVPAQRDALLWSSLPFPTIFHGASLLARLKYLSWLSDSIVAMCTPSKTPAKKVNLKKLSFLYLLKSADSFISKPVRTGDVSFGYELMYDLLIEPFYRPIPQEQQIKKGVSSCTR